MANDYNLPPSRLSESTAKLREELVARNLYAPDTQYSLGAGNVATKTVNAVNSIIGGLTPFKSFNLENTTYGRLLTGSQQTPLTTIGLAMLGKQFAYNASSSIAQDNFPVIKVGNLFDGKSDNKLFTKRIEYSVTIKTGSTGFQNFLNSIISKYPIKNYPFNKNSSNSDFIKNTGEGQLQFLYSSINTNVYKQINDNTDTTFYDYADKVNTSITPRSNIIVTGVTKFFDFDTKKFYPYFPMISGKYSLSLPKSVKDANNSMISAFNSEQIEYGHDVTFIDNLGKSSLNTREKVSLFSNNEWIDSQNEFANEKDKKIIWGKDGITSIVDSALTPLRGDVGDVNSGDWDITNSESNFKINYSVKGGLLEYTRNLVKATQGQMVDMTRKAFMRGDNIVGFQGSGLFTANSSEYASSKKNKIAGKTGVRQHTVLDQYDRFAKAIRFDGNNVYNGNPNSVIYNSVLPRIHPTMDNIGNKEVLNNKNLMLSIENLAVLVTSDPESGIGITDDEYGSAIPACEVGPFKGRIMWFPPFNMELQETSTAKYEPTVMIGRNEPMYNYQNSERTAILNFTLLIDYPPQVKNLKNSKNPQKELAEFFAFGGNPYTPDNKYVNDLQIELVRVQGEIDDIQNKKPQELPDLIVPKEQYLYFPNDIPKRGDNLNTIVDDMYKNYTYEIIDGFKSSDGKTFGLNRKAFFITGLSETFVDGKYKRFFTAPPTFSQYTATGTIDQYGEISELNDILKTTFENEDHRKYFNITIEGGASKLYTEGNPKDVEEEIAYNKALGQRRADATKVLVEKRLVAMFGANVLKDINITAVVSKGSESANPTGATAAAIPLESTKKERYAKITFKKNDNYAQPKEVPLTTQEKYILDILFIRLRKIQQLISDGHNAAKNCVMKERNIESAILGGFKSITDDYYYPIFHSQTPEDFHKRLTFLQQCTRQGSAKSYSAKVDENGVLRARNSVFGRQPICILRVGDFWYTKVIIESVNVDYSETTWDMNPEGFGMQPMLAKVSLNMKVIGGQSLKGPIDALQNAATYNYYANSTYSKEGRYLLPSAIADLQDSYRNKITVDSEIISDFKKRNAEFIATQERQRNIHKE